jgi:hypothetical protein
MSNQVFLLAQDQVHGPYDYAQILDGVRGGQITPQHVMSYDAQNWFPASSIWPQLLEQAGIAPAQAPSAVPTANYAPAVATSAPPSASGTSGFQLNTTTNPKKEEAPKESLDSWQGKLLFALGAFAGAAFLYYIFDKMEAEGGSMRIHWIIAIAYNLGGKWVPVGLCLVLGALFGALGISEMVSPKRTKK